MPGGRVRANKWNRRLHRWGAAAIAWPVALVIATGLLLQVKKQSAWVQPPTARGSAAFGDGGVSALTFEEILAVARGVPEAGIDSWDDVDRLDVRPGRGIVKVRADSRWEVQIDMATGEVLGSAYRRSDLIESLHDGSFFGDWAKLWVFLPAGIVLAALWITGIWLWWMPHAVRRRKRKGGGSVASGGVDG